MLLRSTALCVLLMACGDDSAALDAGSDASFDSGTDTSADVGDAARTTSLELDNAVIAETDPRYLSVAVDTAQVVGGEFWASDGTVGIAGGMEVPPYDFTRPRLRALAAELAPGFLRIGGSDADLAYFDFSDEPLTHEDAPEGYSWVFTREQYDGVFEFANALGFSVMFTINGGPGPRNESFVWQPEQAQVVLDYTQEQGYDVGLWELTNEPNGFVLFHETHLTGEQLATDYALFRTTVRNVFPDARIGGPSNAFWPIVGEPNPTFEDFFAAGGGTDMDVVSFHYYPQQSIRCPVMSRPAQEDTLMNARNLDEVARWAVTAETAAESIGAEVYLGESGHAQCGGAPGLSDAFAGSFWWMDQLGQLAARGTRAVVRQTLSGSDYGILNDDTLDPRPDYWTSVLWMRLMGTRVLGVSQDDTELRTYAHCTRDREGAVTVLLINLATTPITVQLEGAQERYVMTGESLSTQSIELNGETLVDTDGILPPLEPAMATGALEMPARSIAFVVLPDAASVCD